MNYRLAIIGASTGQLPICIKAKEMGIETFCFSYSKDAVCKNVAEHFFPISILEKDEIVRLCKSLDINGVVSNASDLTSEIAAFVSEQLGLVGAPYSVITSMHDKLLVRRLTSNIKGLSSPAYYKYEGKDEGLYPCVVKPTAGSAKKGVSFVESANMFDNAINYAKQESSAEIIVEQYIEGKELSVESISFKGGHFIVQITDKDSSGAPHFVELGHHQPANISEDIKRQISFIVPQILNAIGYSNGASHIELKYNSRGLYLIEANLRGGGDEISNKLVLLSSGVDYLKCMIEVALDIFKKPVQIASQQFAGIYYLCSQTSDLTDFFNNSDAMPWLVEKKITSQTLIESHSNYERNGYLIYKSDKKISPYE